MIIFSSAIIFLKLTSSHVDRQLGLKPPLMMYSQIIALVRGGKNKALERFGLSNSALFGVLKKLKARQLEDIIHRLIQMKVLDERGAKNAMGFINHTICLGMASHQLMHGRLNVQLKVGTGKNARKAVVKKKAKPNAPTIAKNAAVSNKSNFSNKPAPKRSMSVIEIDDDVMKVPTRESR